MIRVSPPALSVLSLLVSAAAIAPTSALAACDPFTTPPVYDQGVPSLTEVPEIGFAFGSEQVTAADSQTYLAAVDAASSRVVTGVAATSVGGRPLGYAIVGTPDRVTPAGLDAIRDEPAVLRDPDARPRQLAAALAGTPAILWVTANVHGNEESGTDASSTRCTSWPPASDCVVTEHPRRRARRHPADPEPGRSRGADRAATCTAST